MATSQRSENFHPLMGGNRNGYHQALVFFRLLIGHLRVHVCLFFKASIPESPADSGTLGKDPSAFYQESNLRGHPITSSDYLNNKVSLSRNYRLIVAPRKFDVLKTNI